MAKKKRVLATRRVVVGPLFPKVETVRVVRPRVWVGVKRSPAQEEMMRLLTCDNTYRIQGSRGGVSAAL